MILNVKIYVKECVNNTKLNFNFAETETTTKKYNSKYHTIT